MASNLVDAATADNVDLSQYKDHYTERTTKLIEVKLSGQKLTAPAREKAPPVINLMDALRKSLNQKRSGRTATSPHIRRAKRKTG